MLHRYNIIGTGISLTASTAKTVAAVAPGTTRSVRLLGVNIGFDSTTTTDSGVLLEVVRFDGTTAGTPGSSPTPVAQRAGIPAAISGGRVNFSAEPTVATVIWATRVTPIGSTIILPFPPDREIEMAAGGANAMLGVRLTAPNNQSNVVVTLEFSE